MKTLRGYIGIDVSKTTLHVGNPEKFLAEFPNTATGRQRLTRYVKKIDPLLVVLEASGGHERRICEAIQEEGIGVHVAQPGCVRHFAKSIKVLAKTDQIDACVIARFGQATHPSPTAKIPENIRHLRELSDRRDQVVEDRVRESNRLELVTHPHIVHQIQVHITQLRQLEKELETQIETLRLEDKELKQKSETMMQLKGVGKKTAYALLAHLPELGTLTREQIAALAGLAPYARDSGNWKGKRTIYGGRAVIRKAMYLAARVASRWCSVIGEYYRRLREKGKPYKVAIIACARKMLTRINTLLKQQDNPVQNGPLAT